MTTTLEDDKHTLEAIGSAVDDDQVYPPSPPLVVPTFVVDDEDEKRGHMCCDCCCDTRRAVVIVNIVCLHLLVVELLVAEDAGLVALLMVVMVASILGIVGALKYNRYLVGVALIPHILDAIVACFLPEFWIVIPIALLLAYPHVMFIKEVNDGIMSRETYAREQASCCCV